MTVGEVALTMKMVLRQVVRGRSGSPERARLCVDAIRVVAGEVKARCGTSFYKNVCYPFVKMYDPEDSHNLSIKVRCAQASRPRSVLSSGSKQAR